VTQPPDPSRAGAPPAAAPRTHPSGPEGRPAIRVAGLVKRFGDLAAVDGIDFAVPRGETLALLGANGAGKTTTISMLLGLLLPSAGTIEMLGRDMRQRPTEVLERINFSSPYVDLPRRLTVEQNLVFFARLYGVPDVRDRLAELERDLELEALWRKRTGQLSAGQKTRVSLAKALINRPEVLLLDEPTASLDPDTADWLRGYLERYQASAGTAILLASHNMAEVERLSHQVLMMRAGKVVDRGTPRQLIGRYGRDTLEEVFLEIARSGARPDDAGAGAAA
jgi:ABC-2 type transport system ATP-binding protein